MTRYSILALALCAAPASALAQPARPPQIRAPDREQHVPAHTPTVRNLQAAVEGEANATRRYTLFAQQADREGYPEVARLFRAVAMSESIHRKNHEAALRELGIEPREPEHEQVEVRSTRDNLEIPIRGESQEESETYPAFIEQARRDHLPAAAQSFTYAMKAEAEHERLFRSALDTLGEHRRVRYFVGKKSGDTVTTVPTGAPEAYVEVR